MIRKFLSITAIALLVASCGNTGDKAKKKAADAEEFAKVEFAALIANPDEFVGKAITLDGQVVHVCQHTGKKMYIVGEDPDIRLFITVGEEMPKFEQELLGSNIEVSGIFKKLEPGEKGMGEGEGEHMGEGEGEQGEMAEAGDTEKPEGEMTEAEHMDKEKNEATGEACETEEAVSKQPVLSDMVLEYRAHIVK